MATACFITDMTFAVDWALKANYMSSFSHFIFHTRSSTTSHFTPVLQTLHISWQFFSHFTFHTSSLATSHFIPVRLPLHISYQFVCHCTFHTSSLATSHFIPVCLPLHIKCSYQCTGLSSTTLSYHMNTTTWSITGIVVWQGHSYLKQHRPCITTRTQLYQATQAQITSGDTDVKKTHQEWLRFRFTTF